MKSRGTLCPQEKRNNSIKKKHQQGKQENEDEHRAIQPSFVKELQSLDNTGTAAEDYQGLQLSVVCIAQQHEAGS